MPIKQQKKEPKKPFSGRKLALTILIGVFISAMVISLVNLTISYVYEPPKYENFCKATSYEGMAKAIPGSCTNANCTFNKALSDVADECTQNRGNAIYEYDNNGCAISIKKCDTCQKDFEDSMSSYNKNVFFFYAAIGFVLIVVGLFLGDLLIQIITLPAGAFLVIEAAVRNIEDKLLVIIVFALLIIAATYLAWKKLRKD
jgi:hypothetical protein